MSRKPIFIGIRDNEVLSIKGVVGESVHICVRNMGNLVHLSGTIVQVITQDHGTLYLIKNKFFHDYKNGTCPRTHVHNVCNGWEYIPLWISECGESGILAVWKERRDFAVYSYIRDYKLQLEIEANNCMAL